MDIDIVTAILRLCVDRNTCLFEIPLLCTYCFEQQLCSNAKYVLASIKNYLEIFKINRDQTRIEFFMPVGAQFRLLVAFSLVGYVVLV